MSILTIVVEYLKHLKQILMKIFGVISVMLIIQENRKCANGLMSKVRK